MAEIKQGVRYEITADDKASAVAEKAAKTVEKSSKEAADAFKGEFNPMSAVLAGISGNTQALAQQMLGLVSRLKAVHMTMKSFALYAALVMAIAKATEFWIGKMREARTAADSLSLEKARGALANINAEQARFNEQLDAAREKSQRLADTLLSEVDATEKLTEARREYTKAVALSLVKSEEERNAIERRTAAEATLDKSTNEKKRIAITRQKTLADIDSWHEQIDDLKDTYAAQHKAAKWASKAQASATKRVRGANVFWHFGIDEDTRLAESAGETYSAARAEMAASKKTIESLEAKIAAAKDTLNKLDMREKALDYEAAAGKISAKTAEKVAAEEAKAKAKAALDAAEKIRMAEMDAIRRKAEEEAKAIKAAQLKANREVMAQRRGELSALTQAESQAAARIAAAQSKVAEAWGWYRNKDAMARVLAEEKADSAAREQFERDFAKLEWRRDWRTAKDLSVDQEAVRRVALAKEEETAAQRALAETAASTAQAAASLAEIEKVITQEG